MSKVVDERIVEMRFDNKQFESNVQTSLSTLDKLKQKLNLSGASKGLENVGSAAKKVNLNPLSNSVENVRMRFSALEVMGVTALANITNSAVNAGKRIVSALTIDPIKSGFQEYETQINSVQTILANTQHAGTNLTQVTAALDELNKYADLTIYNFTEMTRNIGTFTAAGVDLETSVSAIKGIANLAAVSGSTSMQASTAMYQLSQALAAGTVKLQDWNSVVNAGMGGKVFQDALMETAKVHGVAIDDMIKKNGSFRETLQEGWLTSELLTETLEKFTMTTEGLTDAEIEANREKLRGIGYTEEQIDGIFKLGEMSTDAATKVKTFTQWWDVMKESAQSGWAKTWQLIIGDFEDAKTLWTSIANVTTGVIESISNRRNNLIEGVFGGGSDNWPKLAKRIKEAGIATDDFRESLIETAKKHGIATEKMTESEESFVATLNDGWLTKDIFIETLEGYSKGMSKTSESTEDMTAKLKTFQKVVDEVWHGDYKNGQERIEALTKAGYDYAEVQDLVNKTVDGHRLKLEDLSDAQLKNVGYTDEQVKAIRELEKEAKTSGSSVDELIKKMSRPSGRSLLIDTFKNFGTEFKKIIDAVKEAWDNVFGEVDASEMLYNLINGLHELSEAFTISESAATNFRNICEGLFSLFNLGTSIVSMSVIGGLKILSAILEALGTNLLELGGNIGSLITRFAEWVQANTLLIGTWNKIGTLLSYVITGIKDCVRAFLELDEVKKIIEDVKQAVRDFFRQFELSFDGGLIESIGKKIQSIFKQLLAWIKKLPTNESFQAGIDIVRGLAQGIKSGAGQVISAMMDIGSKIISAICGILGIASPSKVMIAIGAFIILGLIQGILSGQNGLFNALKSMFSTVLNTVVDFFQNGFPYAIEVVKSMLKKLGDTIRYGEIDWSALFVAGTIAAATFMIYKLLKVLEKIATPIAGFGKVLNTLDNALKDLAKAKKMEIYSRAIRNIAISIGILAASVFLLAQCDYGKLWSAVGAITAITAVLGGLMFAISKLGINNWEGTVGLIGLSIFLLSLGGALLMISRAANRIASIDSQGMTNLAGVLTGIIIAVVIMIAAFKSLSKVSGSAKEIWKMGVMLLSIGAALSLIALAMKVVAGMSDNDIQKGIVFIGAVTVFFAALMAVSKFAGEHANRAGTMLLRMAVAIGILAIVIKMIGSMSIGEIIKGMAVITGVMLLFKQITMASAFAGKNANKAGTMFFRMAVAIGVLALAMKLIATMSMGDVIKGLSVIAGIELLFYAFIRITQTIEKDAPKAGGMLLGMSTAIMVLAIAIRLLAGIPMGDVIKGLAIIGLIEAMFYAIIKVSQYAGANAAHAGKMLLSMSVAILILVGAIAILSLLKPAKVATGTAAIVAMLGMFALILKASQYAKGMMKSLIVISICIAILGGVLITLSTLDPTGVKTAALAIDGMLAMFALLLAATGLAKKVSPTVFIMVGVVAALAGVLYLIAKLPIDNAWSASKSLSLLLIAMTASLAILSLVGPKALVGAVALGALVVVMALLGLVLAGMNALDVTPSIETAKALSILLLGMSAACVVLGVVGYIGPEAIAGAAILAGVITALGAFIAGVGWISKKIPQLEEFINSGMPIIEKIGYAIGSFFGNIIGGFTSGLTSGLPDIASDLSEFMTNLQPFLDSASNIDENVANNIKSLSGALLALTSSTFLDSLKSKIFGDDNTTLAQFGSDLVKLGASLNAFSAVTSNINADSMNSVIDMVDGLVRINDKIGDSVGLFQNITGRTDLSVWGQSLIKFGEGLIGFSTVLTDNSINTEAIGGAVEASQQLLTLSNTVSDNANWYETFFNKSDLGVWGTNLTKFGQGLVGFSNVVSADGALNTDTMSNAVKAAKGLVELSTAISGSQAWYETFFGVTDMSVWGANLKSFGQGLVGFSQAVSSENGIPNADAISGTVEATKSLLELSDIISENTTWQDAIPFFSDMDAFSSNIKKFGKALSDYGNSVAKVNNDKIRGSVIGAKGLAEVAAVVPKDGFGQNDLAEFGSTAVKFAEKLQKYSDSVGDIDISAINSSVTAANKIVNLTKSMSGINTSGVSKFQTAVNSLSQTNVSGFVTAFKGASSSLSSAGTSMMSSLVSGLNAGRGKLNSAAKSITSSLTKTFTSAAKNLRSAGGAMATNLANGLKAKASAVKSAAKSAATSAASGAKAGYSGFYSAGKYLVQGFAAGIRGSAYLAISAARYAALAAKQAIDRTLRINSPAKALIPSGSAVVEGLAKGMLTNLSYVKDAGKTVAEYARDTISDTVSRISNTIDAGIDANPTIRPVVDLSSVESGTEKINEMLNLGSSVGVLTNVGRINNAMNRRNQNGTNSDIISAIDKLRGDLGNVGNTSYSINGITYDDGSNISDAVRTLVRAAKIERRV